MVAIQNGRLRQDEDWQCGGSNPQWQRLLVHGEIVVDVAAQRGVKINVDGSGLRVCMESSFQAIQAEATRKLRKWDENIESTESCV